jgi:hypothetical protein
MPKKSKDANEHQQLSLLETEIYSNDEISDDVFSSSDFGFDAGYSETKELKKDIGKVIDQIVNFAERGKVFY